MNARTIIQWSESAPPILREWPVIGCRWKPGVIQRHDTETGLFECVNSAITSATEIATQRALLSPVSVDTARRIAQAKAAKHINKDAPR